MYYIGIDLGTSAVKLLLMDEKGTIQKITSREYPIFFPKPAWSEQNPLDWFSQTIEGLKELLKDCDRSKVAGISFGGQMHGLVALDEKDEVIRPAILWNDSRTTEECDYLNCEVGQKKLAEYTGNISFTGFTAPKVLWMKKNEPENFARIAKIMLPKDYLCYKISGVFSTDVSDASGTLYFDVKEEWLPKVYESYQAVGTLKPEIAGELGLSPEVKIAAGAGDNAAAAVGTGIVGKGALNISLGTSGTLFIPSECFRMDEHNALHAFAHADGNYHLMGCMLSAASCNMWWMDEIIGTKEYGKEQENIKNLGENHVYFLPYLMGERSPHNDPLARGTFIGITMDTRREDMTQAVLEGVAFALKDSLEIGKKLGIKVSVSKICGGGAKSSLWKKIVANILNLTLEVPENEEGPSMGAAMLAAVACGEYDTVEEAAKKICKVKEVMKPEETLVKKYEKQYDKFKEIYPALKPVFQKLWED